MVSPEKLEKRIDDAFDRFWCSINGFGGNPPSKEDEDRCDSAYHHFIQAVKRVVEESEKLSPRVQRRVYQYIENKYPSAHDTIHSL